MKGEQARLDWREGRRRRGWELKEAGWKQQDIAAALGVTPGAVSQWLKRARADGVEDGLRRHPAAGPSPKLSPAQLAQRPALLDRGAEAYGFRGQVWTGKRVGEVIRRPFGVTDDPSHLSRLLHRLGYRVQRPIERATQRNEAAIRGCWEQRWPALKKSRRRGRGDGLGRPVGVSLLPHHVRTWARCRQTPVLRVPLTREHRSAIGALSSDGRLFLQPQSGAYHRVEVIRFLRLLWRKRRGKLLISWDGAPIHRGQPIKDFRARGAAKRIHLEPLPGYAPDLNPVEGIWNDLQCRELGTLCCKDFPELDRALRRAKERLRHKRHVLLDCIRECGYHV